MKGLRWLLGGLAGLLGVCGLAFTLSERAAMAELQRAAAPRLDLYASSLVSALDKFEYLPYLLSGHPLVQELLSQPDSLERVMRVNHYLEDANQHAHSNNLFILNAAGLTLASSNWQQPGSFIGNRYDFRPYYQAAIAGRTGRFFGIGSTTGEPGYFIAHPVRREGQIVGVAVAKVSLDWLEAPAAAWAEPIMVSDENGVVFLSSVPAWRYRTLQPLDERAATHVAVTRQYHPYQLAPLGLHLSTHAGGGRIASLPGPGRAAHPAAWAEEHYLLQGHDIQPQGWRVMLLSRLDGVRAATRNATLAAALAYALLVALLLYQAQRRRRIVEAQRARAALEAAYGELEQRVVARTADLIAANTHLQDEIRERIRTAQELVTAQNELVQASKLAVLGQMAAGVTHELNQPLTAMRGYADNARVLLKRQRYEDTDSNLLAISGLVERMGKITGQLKLFARKTGPSRYPVAVRSAIDNSLALLERYLRETRARVSLDMADPAPMVLGDDVRLEQVLINLLRNALDAMHGLPAPCIEIRVQTQGDVVDIVVRDHGPGFAPDALTHIFEPFFSTKGHHGLGLGLAISNSIVRECGGQLSASNHPEGGAQLTVRLALAGGEHAPGHA